MKKFEFKFAAVLKVRKNREERALRELATAQRAYQSELAEKSALVKALEDSFKRREDLGAQPTGANIFQVEQNFIDGTKQRIVRSDHAILRASKAVEKTLRAYLLARRQTRMIEVLREKAYTEYKRERNKRELKAMDDASIMRARFRQEIA